MSGSKIKVLVADDHAMLREGIRALLSTCPNIELVGEATSGREAVEKSRKLRPDVVLMDISMPDMDGLEATHHIHEELPSTKILVLTQHDDREYISSSVRAGASGYLPKRAVSADLISAIRAVHQGDSYLYPSVAHKLIEDYLGYPDLRAAADPYARLSKREREVLRLVAEGRSSREIAARLGITLKTVMAHRANVMSKLGLHSRVDLVKYAIRHRLIDIDA